MRPILYTKIGCPWCTEAREDLVHRGIQFIERNVTANSDAMADMVRISGQSKAPVLDWNGEVLADFGRSELTAFLERRAQPPSPP